MVSNYKRNPYELNIRLAKLVLTNYRGLRGSLEVDFDEKLTVFIGENGSGKTSLVEAAAATLSELLRALFLIQDEDRFLTTESDVNNGVPASERLRLEMSAWVEYHDIFLKGDEEDGSESYEIQMPEEEFILQIKTAGGRGLVSEGNFSKVVEARDNILEMVHPDDPDKALYALPVVAYYPNASVEMATKSQFKPSIEDIDDLYKDALRSVYSFRQFKNWFRWATQLVEQRHIEEKTKMLVPDKKKQIAWIKTAVLSMMNDGPETADFEKLAAATQEAIENDKYDLFREADRFSDIGIGFNQQNTDGSFVLVRPDGTVVFDNQLSSGEKTVFALVGDIAYRLVLANYYHDRPLEGSGIVIIDEIDLHLHPRWQRAIVPKLRAIFPNIQFILTTHSPLLLGEIHHRHVRLLKEGEIVASPPTHGRDPKNIIEDVFHMSERNEQVKKRLEEFYKKLDLDVEEAETILDELEKSMGENDEEIIRARAYLEIF